MLHTVFVIIFVQYKLYHMTSSTLQYVYQKQDDEYLIYMQMHANKCKIFNN